jgi:predicted CoA-binding protein
MPIQLCRPVFEQSIGKSVRFRQNERPEIRSVVTEVRDPADPITRFLASPAFGVVGASPRRHKYGNKVLRCYQQAGRRAIPVNPRETEIEGAACVASVLELPDDVKSLSVITPPAVTERVVEEAISKGIEHVWMQPGAESDQAVAACEAAGINVIADGSCVLVVLGYRER